MTYTLYIWTNNNTKPASQHSRSINFRSLFLSGCTNSFLKRSITKNSLDLVPTIADLLEKTQRSECLQRKKKRRKNHSIRITKLIVKIALKNYPKVILRNYSRMPEDVAEYQSNSRDDLLDNRMLKLGGMFKNAETKVKIKNEVVLH